MLTGGLLQRENEPQFRDLARHPAGSARETEAAAPLLLMLMLPLAVAESWYPLPPYLRVKD